MLRRAFLHRMACAVLGVGLLGSELLGRLPRIYPKSYTLEVLDGGTSIQFLGMVPEITFQEDGHTGINFSNGRGATVDMVLDNDGSAMLELLDSEHDHLVLPSTSKLFPDSPVCSWVAEVRVQTMKDLLDPHSLPEDVGVVRYID